MCGRYSLTVGAKGLGERFAIVDAPEFPPRYNIAPSQDVLALLAAGQAGATRAVRMRWGFSPLWQKKPTRPMINARAETAAVKPTFRAALASRRCLVVADGFYEWPRGAGPRQPWRFIVDGGAPFAFAGFWQPQEGIAGDYLACCILTTAANDVVTPLHERMPVILDAESERLWLGGDQDAANLLGRIASVEASRMSCYLVSKRVNAPTFDDPACVEPAI